MALRKLMKALRHTDKVSTQKNQKQEKEKPLRIRGGCISTANLDDPTSKHYKEYSGHGFEMWGSHMGDRLESLGRSISRGGQQYVGPVLYYYHPPSTQVIYHHYHQCHHDQNLPQYTRTPNHGPQHVFRGWGGAAVDGFEHKQ
ncbi:hypothetical protein I204_06132 [Kwoniella mangroviensis CBS 8886]|nr:hypothetical protein I204_06132 [Kwoniella mangroviensis CBS 8886]